jgi:hypothetical protein
LGRSGINNKRRRRGQLVNMIKGNSAEVQNGSAG